MGVREWTPAVSLLQLQHTFQDLMDHFDRQAAWMAHIDLRSGDGDPNPDRRIEFMRCIDLEPGDKQDTFRASIRDMRNYAWLLSHTLSHHLRMRGYFDRENQPAQDGKITVYRTVLTYFCQSAELEHCALEVRWFYGLPPAVPGTQLAALLASVEGLVQ